MGEDEAVWVGDDLQEDVHRVQDGGQTSSILVIQGNLERMAVWGSLALLDHCPLRGVSHPASAVPAGPWGPLRTQAVSGRCPYLLGEHNTARLRHPFAGVDAGVDPDGRAVRTPFAELEEQRCPPPKGWLCPWPRSLLRLPHEPQILTLST